VSQWTDQELIRIARADELMITTFRADGSLRPPTPIWVVHAGDAVYVRSYRGRASSWFRRTLAAGRADIRAGGVQRETTVEEPDDSPHAEIDEAYRSKYARYGNTYVAPMVAPEARAATLRLLPR